jgi:NADH-quinone oxidoreductase subunit L
MNLPLGDSLLAEWLGNVVNVTSRTGRGFDSRVALISTVLALIAIALSWVIYGRAPLARVEDRDPLATTGPVFTFLNRRWYWDDFYNWLFVGGYVRAARFLADRVDGDFWHDFVHDTIITQFFRGWALILSRPVDLRVVDGAVNGIAELIGGSSQGLRRVQTGTSATMHWRSRSAWF